MAVHQRDIHPKSLAIEGVAAGGTVDRQLERAEGLLPTLTDEEVRAIAAVGVEIERHYGAPQDTEWAIDAEGSIWILQARPVTAAGAGFPSRRPAPPRRCASAA